MQQPAGQQHYRAPQQHRGHALGVVVGRQDHAAHQITDEHMGDARQCAQDALGVKRDALAKGPLVVHVVSTQDAVINLGDDVLEREVITMPQTQNQRIGNQNDTDEPRNELAAEQHHT